MSPGSSFTLPPEAALGARRPDAGIAVGLEFESDGILVGLRLAAGALLGLLDLVGYAGQLLDVVAEFMRDDIGAGEVGAGCAKLCVSISCQKERSRYTVWSFGQ